MNLPVYQSDQVTLYQGDCLEVMQDIPDKSIDMILCDLPYGSTSCKWDVVIPFKPLWEAYERVIKDIGAIVLTSSQPFTSLLVTSNINMFKYEWIWKKRKPGNFQLAKKVPLKVTENILVFSRKNKYYPIPRPLPKSSIERRKYPIESNVLNLNHMASGRYKFQNNMGTGFGYPFNIIEIGQDAKSYHPTQKPVALFEYLIKTYTNEGDLVLDNCLGSGTTAISCLNTNRRCIGIEKELKYIEISKNRVIEHETNR